MVVYENFLFIFQANLKNQEIVYQHNIAEKYYKIWRSAPPLQHQNQNPLIVPHLLELIELSAG